MSYFEWDLQSRIEVLSVEDCIEARRDIEHFQRETLGGQLLVHALREARAQHFEQLFAAGRGNTRADEQVGVTNGRLDVLCALETPGLGLGGILDEAAKQKRGA